MPAPIRQEGPPSNHHAPAPRRHPNHTVPGRPGRAMEHFVQYVSAQGQLPPRASEDPTGRCYDQPPWLSALLQRVPTYAA